MLSEYLKLDSLLIQNQDLWRFEPFQLSESQGSPWKERAQLNQWLAALTIEDVIHFKADHKALLNVLIPIIPEVEILESLCMLSHQKTEGLCLPRGFDSGIPGRKLSQILAMSEYSLSHHIGSEWLEWCSGKGYLGRILAQQSHQKVTSLEWQQPLCDAGQKEADSKNLPMTFVQGDAFADSSKALFSPQQHAVALHACGDLHIQLIKNSVSNKLNAVTLSPCCYHLIRDDVYQPLSEAAKQSELKLTKHELRIPLQETVTGGERVRKHRQQEMSYRLGLDLLLKAETQYQEYICIPSIKKSELSKGFESFCRWSAEKKGITLPDTDFDYWFKQGEKRFWYMEKLSLVQQVFRRPLEMWLVLDRALYLQENGYRVSVSAFCDREVTPRNILIHGVLRTTN